MRDDVEHPLVEERRLETPRAAKYATRRLVAHAAMGLQIDVGDPVRPRQELGHDTDRVGDAGSRIGADVDRGLAAQSEDGAVAAARHLDGAGNIAGVVDGDEMLAAVLDPFDRAPEVIRRKGDQEVLG